MEINPTSFNYSKNSKFTVRHDISIPQSYSSSTSKQNSDSSSYSEQDSVDSLNIYNGKCSILDIRSKYKLHSLKKSESNNQVEKVLRDDKATCRYCKRTFFSNRLEKHEKACQNASKRRPVFDMKYKRVPNSEYPSFTRNTSIRRAQLKLNFPDSKWQKQHSDFQSNIKFARKLKYMEEAGVDITHIRPPPSKNEDYIQCPYCFRKYAPIPAERHIPKCKDIIHKPRPLPQLQVCSSNKLPMISLRDTIIKTPSNRSIVTYDRAYSDSTKSELRNFPQPETSITVKNRTLDESTTLRNRFSLGSNRANQLEQLSIVSKCSSQNSLIHTPSKILTAKPLTPITPCEPSSSTHKLPIKRCKEPPLSIESKFNLLSQNRAKTHKRQLTALKYTDQNFKSFKSECSKCHNDLPIEANFCMICGKARYL